MTKIYDGSGKTTYSLNSGRVIVLNDEEFDELVVGSEKLKELRENIMELEVEVECEYKKVYRLENDISEYQDDEIVQLIRKLRKLGGIDIENFLEDIEDRAKAILGGKNENN